MATTTNFGWTTPNDTDLVKDGAAAIRTLGSAIDTSFVDLKGGTTNQVLTKASNTDLDFTWATTASGGMTSIASGSLTGTSVTISAIDQSYKNIQLVVKNSYPANAGASITLRLNGDTSSVYTQFKGRSSNSTPFVGTDTAWYFDDNAVGSANTGLGQLAVLNFYNYADTQTRCVMDGPIYYVSNSASTPVVLALTGLFRVTDNIDSITIGCSSGSFAAGSYILYGVN